MYFDLNVPFDPNNLHQVKQIIAALAKLGYGCVALNHVVTGRLAASDACQIKPIDLASTADKDAASAATSSTDVTKVRLKSSGEQLQQLTRITLHLEDPGQGHALSTSNPILLSYDLVAVVPKTEAMLLRAVQSKEIDLISLELGKRSSFPVKLPIVSQAIASGIYFEVSMADLLDTSARKHVIANVTHLLTVTRGRNMLFTGGASSPLLTRNPYDLANLACLFGMEAAVGKNCLNEHPRAVVLHAETRSKTSKGTVRVTNIADLPADQKWTVPSDPFQGVDDPMDTTDTTTSKDAPSRAKRKRPEGK